MRIAIISWGSLVHTGFSRGLQIEGEWKDEGPVLPIEFSRVSKSGDMEGSLTLVIDEQNGSNVPTQYAISSNRNLDMAITNLQAVERINLVYSIGYVNIVHNTEREWARRNTPITCNTIKAWAQDNSFDAVIWTSLLPNFEAETQFSFNLESAVQYISHLPEPKMSKAFNYIRNAPINVITPLRRVLDDAVNNP